MTMKIFWSVLFLVLFGHASPGRIQLGSILSASEDRPWVSDNGTFAFGFTPLDSSRSSGQFQLGIWFAHLPGDRTLVWTADINSPATKDAALDFDPSGNLVLTDQGGTLWTSNTSNLRAESASMLENGNFVLHGAAEAHGQQILWQTFSHPSDTLLPGQPLTASLELKTSPSPSPSHGGGYYTLKMLQQPTSLSLALTYNLPETSPESLSNFSYWSGPDISNVTGEVSAVLDQKGSFGIVYGSASDGAVYVYKNDNDGGGLSSSTNITASPLVLRRLILEKNGNLRLYKWDNDVNGSRQWVPEWAAVSKPCDIAGICGNGICNIDKTTTDASCSCLPGTSKARGGGDQCWGNSSLSLAGRCGPSHETLTPNLKVAAVQLTNYYFSDSSVIANYSDDATVSKCGEACLDDCECVASIYGLDDELAYCWLLRSLEFGGYDDPGSTLFVKVEPDGSLEKGSSSSKGLDSREKKVLVVPIVLSMAVLIGLLCALLYIYVRRRRKLSRAFESALIVLGAPVEFSYRDLQHRTNSFSELLGTGGFGSVYKGNLRDGTLIAVKKLERVLPHGEKEFVTEVNTIGSMHHMNLVRLWGYCAEGSHRLLVYEFMKNGSLDKWIFPSGAHDRSLDWPTRFRVAIGTAQGIAYFHEQCRDRIIHCDIKPENILLDENYCPKVSDFGLAKLMGREASRVVTMIRGTRGYLAPEWVSNRPITVKADVYSYGMLLLEIVGGRRNLDMSCDAQEFFYPEWAFKELTSGMPSRVADRRLAGAIEEDEVVRALKVAFWCIQEEIVMRPTMGDVVRMLEGSVEINMPPMPQAVAELIDEGLDHVYKAMKREFNQLSSWTTTTNTNITHPFSNATCSYSTISPR